MNISVIGIGYVGLTTGTCFAELGNNVLCMDSDEEKIERLKNGLIPIYEPGMEELVKKNYSEKRLDFTTNLLGAINFSDLIFIAVGTPTNHDNSPNLKYLKTAAKEIAALVDRPKLIVIKSTVPVGTCRTIKNDINNMLRKNGKSFEIDVASNPEFLREGTAIYDFISPDRLVIGVDNEESKTKMTELYDYYLKEEKPSVISGLEEAEMIKYVSNAFLATKISYINEVALLCERYRVDVSVVSKGMGLDKRIGDKFLNPGPGYGGSCFPKDTSALMYIGKSVDYMPRIIKATIEVNNAQIKFMEKKIKKIIKKIRGKTITVLGVAFKPGTDDIREAPAIKLIEFLIKSKAIVKIYDPKAMENCKNLIKKVECCEDVYAACTGSEGIIVLTEWDEFNNIDFEKLKGLVKEPVLIDMRNMYEPDFVRNKGFLYESVGRI